MGITEYVKKYAGFSHARAGRGTVLHRSNKDNYSGYQSPARAVFPFSDTPAISIPAVYRAVNILQTAVSQLTLDAWENDKPLNVQRDLRVVYRPDAQTTLSEFLQSTVYSLAVHGNAFWRVWRDKKNNITSLQVLPPALCVPWLDETGKTWTSYQGKDYAKQDIYQLKKFARPWQAYGLSPLQAASRSIHNSLKLEEYATELAATGEVPSGILTLSPQIAITQQKLEEYRDLWNKRPKGVAVLQPGVSYEAVSLSPRDLQFLESRNFNILEIARLFGIPPKMLLISPEGNTETYSNLQDEDLAFLKWTLSEYTREIENAFTWLLPPSISVRFNIDAFLRPATLQRYQAHEIAARAGFKTLNEIREDEGLSPLDKG